MPNFKHITANNNLRELVKSAFDTEIKLAGAWGYNKEESTIIQANEHNLPLAQFEHTLASMRAYLEMNMTQEKEDRYGSINLNETARESFDDKGLTFHKVGYEITAMKDEDYATFINEYKEGYGKDNFDLADHFKRRKKATLTRVVNHWFEVSSIL